MSEAAPNKPNTTSFCPKRRRAIDSAVLFDPEMSPEEKSLLLDKMSCPMESNCSGPKRVAYETKKVGKVATLGNMLGRVAYKLNIGDDVCTEPVFVPLQITAAEVLHDQLPALPIAEAL